MRLARIFMACNNHKHHVTSKTIPEWMDTLQQIWIAFVQKSIAKGVKDFPKWLEIVCQLIERILNIKCDQWHNSY